MKSRKVALEFVEDRADRITRAQATLKKAKDQRAKLKTELVQVAPKTWVERIVR